MNIARRCIAFATVLATVLVVAIGMAAIAMAQEGGAAVTPDSPIGWFFVGEVLAKLTIVPFAVQYLKAGIGAVSFLAAHAKVAGAIAAAGLAAWISISAGLEAKLDPFVIAAQFGLCWVYVDQFYKRGVEPMARNANNPLIPNV